MSEVFPSPSGDSYNPRLFMLMATDPDVFERQLPPIVHDLSEMGPDMVMTPALQRIRGTSEKFRVQTPLLFLNAIYANFARERDWMEDGESFLTGFRVPQSMESFTEVQEEEWRAYRLTAEVPREVGMVALNNSLFILNNLPSPKYLFDDAAENMIEQIRGLPYALIMRFFPDITDCETLENFHSPLDHVLSRASQVQY